MQRLKSLFASLAIGLGSGAQAKSDTASEGLATFAGGCFWCMEAPFEAIDGVKSVVSGYMGGKIENPTYQQVSAGGTGHAEVIHIEYDPEKVSYETLLDTFWRNIDPTDPGGQFADRGSQYRTEIFYHNEDQKKLAEKSKAKLSSSGKFHRAIVTNITASSKFYKAEDYHQDYFKKNPTHYKRYKEGSGRAPYLRQVWGEPGKEKKVKYSKPDDSVLKTRLSPLQYKVTQKDGTEAPFKNEYWDNKAQGIYVDVVSGEPLFSSTAKYDSGTGWPSFYEPIDKTMVVEKEDRKLFSVRTEVRSKHGDSHLGHVFPDGPKPTGLRYCINSAALRFIPKEKLESEGYGEYLKLFK